MSKCLQVHVYYINNLDRKEYIRNRTIAHYIDYKQCTSNVLDNWIIYMHNKTSLDSLLHAKLISSRLFISQIERPPPIPCSSQLFNFQSIWLQVILWGVCSFSFLPSLIDTEVCVSLTKYFKIFINFWIDDGDNDNDITPIVIGCLAWRHATYRGNFKIQFISRLEALFLCSLTC
jgi:hypothetical protein